MKRILFTLWAICTSLCASLSSEIIEAYDLSELADHFQTLDAQSLLLWDVDSTLIVPADQVLSPGNEDFREELETQYLGSKTYQEVGWLVSKIFHRMSFCLVDEQVVDLISTLRNRSIPMLGFTAMETGPFGVIESMEEWRINQLRDLGIDFSAVFPQHSDLEWEETSPFYGYPAFREGILCSDRLPKGVVLTTFLQKIEWRPTRILFIDDNLNFLKSVDTAMEALNIPFIGVHYRAVERIKSPLDEELAHHQFHLLINEQVWLPDHEAKTYPRADPQKS